MSKYANAKVITTHHKTHPAVIAWLALRSQNGYPQSITTIKEKRKKSAVYRLQGVGASGSVIAKRCQRDIAQFERFCYETVLPHLPVLVLELYGCLDEPESDYSWLFIEDAGELAYSPLNEVHRGLAVQYLSQIHTSTWRDPVLAYLPDRGANHYLEHLCSARERIMSNRDNPTLTDEDLTLADSILSKLEVVESHWGEIVSFCTGMPRTIVHGDFVPKNLRVRKDQTGLTLLLFDWETVGHGVPAADLANCSSDCEAYWVQVQQHWPHLNSDDIRQLTIFGKFFRVIAGINWESWCMGFGKANRNMASLKIFGSMLARLMHTVQWIR